MNSLTSLMVFVFIPPDRWQLRGGGALGHAQSVPVVLFVPYYMNASADRQLEIDGCLEANVRCDAISRIILMIDDGSEPKITSPKIEISRTIGRPTYQRWVDLSRQISYPCISVLANSDISFDKSARLFEECFNNDRPSFVALTRRDQDNGKLIPHPNPHWSQDVWALKFPAHISEQLFGALNFPLGVPRCDNRVAYLFKMHGWRVVNPFHDIVATHIHETQMRNYDKTRDTTIIGGVAYVHPCGLTENSDIDIDVWTLDNAQIRTVNINATLQQWLAGTDNEATVQKFADPQVTNIHRQSKKPKKRTLGRSIAHSLRDWSRRVRNKERPGETSESVEQTPAKPAASSQKKITGVSPALSMGIVIKSRPPKSGDPHFWQYPCFTEKQAHDNHTNFPSGCNIDERERTIHTYLGLPWATYIDLRAPVDDLLARVGRDVERHRIYAASEGYSLRVHSVCQHYAWHRLGDAFVKAGITDLHLSHCTDKIIASEANGLRFHSWPLFAPNIENPFRARGIEIGAPISKRQYLASFIGSHMPHYRSESRLALQKEAIADGGEDLVVEITRQWHFNRDVYDEQVKGKALEQTFVMQQLEGAARYNRLLSNSLFSLCPDGAGPNTLRLWESLAVGSIPVIIAEGWVPPTLRSVGLEDACIFIPEAEVPGIFDRLRAMSKTEIAERVRACLNCYQAARHATCFDPFHFSSNIEADGAHGVAAQELVAAVV